MTKEDLEFQAYCMGAFARKNGYRVCPFRDKPFSDKWWDGWNDENRKSVWASVKLK